MCIKVNWVWLLCVSYFVCLESKSEQTNPSHGMLNLLAKKKKKKTKQRKYCFTVIGFHTELRYLVGNFPFPPLSIVCFPLEHKLNVVRLFCMSVTHQKLTNKKPKKTALENIIVLLCKRNCLKWPVLFFRRIVTEPNK